MWPYKRIHNTEEFTNGRIVRHAPLVLHVSQQMHYLKRERNLAVSEREVDERAKEVHRKEQELHHREQKLEQLRQEVELKAQAAGVQVCVGEHCHTTDRTLRRTGEGWCQATPALGKAYR